MVFNADMIGDNNGGDINSTVVYSCKAGYIRYSEESTLTCQLVDGKAVWLGNVAECRSLRLTGL